MAEVYGYFNGLEYDEKFPMMRVASLIPTGVYNDSLHVSAGTGLNVSVAAGKAWVNGYFYFDPDAKQITIDIADAEYSRKDIIVLRLGIGNPRMSVAYKKGNPSVYPTPPTLQRNNDQYELQLAEILVPAGSASISAATITDTRSDSGLCGITAGFQGLDVAGLTAQAQAKFDTWFSNLKNQLDTNQAGNLQNQINGKQSQTAARSAMVKADADGKLVQAIPNIDYAVTDTVNLGGLSWTNYLEEYGIAKALKLGKMVYLSGMIKGANPTTKTDMVLVPDGYRPTARLIGTAMSGIGPVRVDVYPDGTVSLLNAASFSNQWLSLNGLCYPTV